MKTKLVEGKDYYFNTNGLMVFTKEYHLKRGYCCQSGCENCPFGFKKIDPSIPIELQLNDDEDDSIYYEQDEED